MIDKQLNHYEIVRKLGEGGMGQVYVARDTKLNRDVALKVLPPDLADDADRLERFEREAKTVAALNHPNIVTIYSVEEAAGVRFMTMELIEGNTLDEVIPKEGLSTNDFLEIAIPLADAVAAAHERGIQHRDLKPANVMVTSQGRVKVLDFGLAKVLQTISGPEGMTQMHTGALTGEGKILGTVAYMSPEQAEGKVLDHRSDIFSLGIVLYEALTGARPFQGDTNLSLLSSILKDEPSSVSDVKKAVPIPVARVINRALAKRPGDRYQSVADLRQDLLDVKRDLDTGAVLESGLYSGVQPRPDLPPTRPTWLRPPLIAAAASVILLATVSVIALRDKGDRDAPAAGAATVPAATDSPAVAVFYFGNLTGDADLDWLRTGLAEMLVTDLSQSPRLRVLGTDRLYSMLEEMGRLTEQTTSFDTIEYVARQAGMNTAVVGGFARIGDQMRIDARVQDARSGDVLASESVSGSAADIFGLVDQLSDLITGNFDMPALSPEMTTAMVDAGMVNRALEEVTTHSVDAYRLYAEGVNLNLQSKEDAAIPLLEQAVALDPEFAMAFAKLSVAYGNEGDTARARERAKRAFELADKLPPRERYYIRGRYYSLSPETIQESIDAYTRTLELFPDHFPARNNLAIELIDLERYDEGIAHLEELRRQGHQFAGSYSTLANAYAITGRYDDAVAVLRVYADANPDNAEGLNNLAVELARAHRFDEALATLARAQELRPDPRMIGFRAGIHLLAENFAAVEADLDLLEQSGVERAAFEALTLRADYLLYRGRVLEARAALQRAAAMAAEGEPMWIGAMGELADLESDLENPAAILEIAAKVRALNPGAGQMQQILVAEAVAHGAMGNEDGVREVRAEFLGLLANLPLPPKTRSRIDHQMDGVLAWARRDYVAAANDLQQALALLPTRDISDEGVAMRYYLARSLLASRRSSEAIPHLEAIRDGTLARVRQGVPWVRSLGYLGSAYAEAGNAPQARRHYERFLRYWRAGEIDRDLVARAEAYLRGNRS